jgi:multidrug efflux pump subunit AcrB/outer membrane protein TolC
MVIAVGAYAFMKMPRTEDPTITIRTGIVAAIYPGATSEQVEKQVTKTLERHIFKFQEVRKDKSYSTSRPGLAIINVELEDHVKNSDQFWAKLRHEMNVTRATELPEGVRGPVVDSDFGDTVAMLIAVHGKGYGYRELKDHVDKIQDEMRTVREVCKLATYGAQSEEIRITGNTQRMSQYFTDPYRVAATLQQRNVITGAGSFDAGDTKVPLRTTGTFTTEEQIGNLLVDVSKDGLPVHIRDFAQVTRRYQDPAFMVRFDGDPCLLLSVEMQKGKNIVELGEKLEKVLARLRTLLPPDVKIDLVADQPEVVKERIAGLSHEFLLAIGSVILVTLFLLPFRVALVAALAIPVTLCGTLGLMNAMGIALHQVSIAALIVVLGIVVDDAIVIADNYVELLDHKVPRKDAAWRCATEVVVPVFTATVTIIASFLPLLILTGSAGEFIAALPITVAIALATSFVVAVLLTPLICRSMISKGLHDHDAEPSERKPRKSLLDRVLDLYSRAIDALMVKKWLAISIGIVAVAAGVGMFSRVPEQFFPSAERNQFVIDVWMPQGTRIEATDAVMGRIERKLAGSRGVAHYVAFVGQSAPRFYYNVNPQQPDAAYGQFIVNTASVPDTVRLVADLRGSLATVAPEAMVIVKELQQGSQLEAPVEVRISGDDIPELKRLGGQVRQILQAIPASQFVHDDYFNESAVLDLNVNAELANRLGVPDAAVAGTLAGAFDGAPVGTFWEGDRAVGIRLRLDPQSRENFADVGNTYVTSALTPARVPLRAIATLAPEWQESRIVRRNGVRTLTVRAFVKPGHYASRLLEQAAPKLAALKLPAGYRVEYGGDRYNRDETMPQMLGALAISLLVIFLVLLMQFKRISDSLVVMSSIPLMLFGAVLGLIVTGNALGFTAFLGLISLCGIVVRNGIILIDYMNERLAQGSPLEEAAKEAGRRRMRPIFLTTMAAAVGVTPMILSGSSLWSPLASVIAFGLIFSMCFTLLVVPVLFVVVRARAFKPAAVVPVLAVLALLGGSGVASADHTTAPLTLDRAIETALNRNKVIRIGWAKVLEGEHKIAAARADRLPGLANSTRYVYLTNREMLTIPAGSMGNIGGGPFPASSVSIDQGSNTVLLSETTLSQPVTQLFKIGAAVDVARADQGIARAELKKSENEVVFAVYQLYYGLLIANREKEAAIAMMAAARDNLREADEGVRSGNLLDVASTAGRVNRLQARQALIAAENRLADLTSEFNDLMGLPLDAPVEVTEAGLPDPPLPTREESMRTARPNNPELAAARETVEKSRSAVRAARYEYIPDVTLFARHVFQDGSAFLPHNVGAFGAMFSWNIFDWGKRDAQIGERKAQLFQAETNLARLDDRVPVEIDKAYRKLERTQRMVEVAREAVALSRENARLSENRLKAGAVTDARHSEAVAAMKKTESEELQASLDYRLTRMELDRITGTLASGRQEH